MKKLVFIVLAALSLGACATPNSSEITSKNSTDSESSTKEAFDISSLNGKSYYFLYESTKQIRVPEKELPYSYDIPAYISSVSSYRDFGWIAIHDSKVYNEHLDFSRKDSVVIYTLIEEELSISRINDRYFINSSDRFGEIIFGEELLLANGFFGTKEYAIKNGYSIFNLESQQKEWLFEAAQKNITAQIREIVYSLTEENNTATLPNKIILNEDNPHIEMKVSYEMANISNFYELNGYDLSLKQEGRIDFDLIATIEYEGNSYKANLYIN